MTWVEVCLIHSSLRRHGPFKRVFLIWFWLWHPMLIGWKDNKPFNIATSGGIFSTFFIYVAHMCLRNDTLSPLILRPGVHRTDANCHRLPPKWSFYERRMDEIEVGEWTKDYTITTNPNGSALPTTTNLRACSLSVAGNMSVSQFMGTNCNNSE